MAGRPAETPLRCRDAQFPDQQLFAFPQQQLEDMKVTVGGGKQQSHEVTPALVGSQPS